MASTQDPHTTVNALSKRSLSNIPACASCLQSDSGEGDSPPRRQNQLPHWQDSSAGWQKMLRKGLPDFVENNDLREPKVALAGGTFVFVWATNSQMFVALPESLESALWLIAYQNPHQYDISDDMSLLTLSDAASLAAQLARDRPNGPYKDVFLTLQALVRDELRRLQQERFWDNIRMSQVPRETHSYNTSFARYLFLVLLAQIGTPAHLTYNDRKVVIAPGAEEGRLLVHQALGETYLVRQAHVSGAITVMYRLLNTKVKVLATLTVNDLDDIANHGIMYESNDLSQWQGLEGWRLTSEKLSQCAE